MLQREIEEAVLSSIDSLESFTELRGKGVTEDSFVERVEVFAFIRDYVREYGKDVPSKDLIKSTFDLELTEKKDDKEFFIKQLLEQETKRKANVVLEKGISLLIEQDKPTEAVGFMITELSKLRKQSRITKNITDSNAMLRLDKLLEKQELIRQGLTIGLRTGLSFFDDTQLGLSPGNLLGIVGNTSVGKSWLLTYVACATYIDGARVLFVSPEMSVDEVESRWDTICGQLLGYEFSNTGLMRGRNINVEKYKEFLERSAKRNDWMTCTANETGRAFTLGGIEDLLLQFKPTVVAVDGVPLIGLDSSASKGELWQRVAEVSYGLKSMAESRGVIMLVTNQATREAEKIKEMGLADIGYAYAFAQACDRVLSISMPKDEAKKSNTRVVRLMKARSSQNMDQSVEIPWTVDVGRIG